MRRASALRRLGAFGLALAATGCSSSIASSPSSSTGPDGATPESAIDQASPGSAQPTTSPTTSSVVSTTVPRRDVSSSTVESQAAATASTCVESLSTAERAALVVWPAAYSSTWNEAVGVVRDVGVGGILLMEPSGWSSTELRRNIEVLDAASTLGVVVATDEEGGDVQRLRAYRDLPSQAEVSATMSPAQAEALITEHGRFVADLGVDVVLGPVVDVLPTATDPPLSGSRFFGGDADAVAEYGAAYVRGWSASGLVPTLKHFPGHGSATGDTHVVAATTPDLASLERSDLVPYDALAGLGPAVMVGHLVVPRLTDDLPATLSTNAIDYLRSIPGFADALVISDALGMDAIPFDVPEAAVMALGAGVDVVLFTTTSRAAEVVDRIVVGVSTGELSGERLAEAATRVADRLPERGCIVN